MKNYSPKITACCLVCNEERWIWYSIMSVLDFVDEILVWDTGSADKTSEIIKSIKSSKIKFREVGIVDAQTFTQMRNQMLSEVKTDWILILDGDEIWTDEATHESKLLMNSNANYLINTYFNPLGDVYHFQNENAGRYKIKSWSGHISIRLVNKESIFGLHFANPYGSEGLVNGQGMLLQNDEELKTVLVKEKYLHATHLERSVNNQVMMRKQKYKYELGNTFPKDFNYPKVFYIPGPQNPWKLRNLSFVFYSCWQTPLRYLKRLFI